MHHVIMIQLIILFFINEIIICYFDAELAKLLTMVTCLLWLLCFGYIFRYLSKFVTCIASEQRSLNINNHSSTFFFVVR